jgi:hypothetical protein
MSGDTRPVCANCAYHDVRQPDDGAGVRTNDPARSRENKAGYNL